jgi:hypothetical protein
VGLIGFARSATRGDYVVSGGDQPRDEEGADVAGSADDDDSNGGLLKSVFVNTGWIVGCALVRLRGSDRPQRLAY